MAGAILAVNKPVGPTSHDITHRIKKLLKLPKVGHGGTLDPFASGVLIVVTGSCTKLMSYLSHSHKQYRATLRLGTRTETADTEGQVVETQPVPTLSPQLLEQLSRELTGTVTLQVPAYSAVKIGGKKAYEYARRGESVEMPTRTTTLHSLRLWQEKPDGIEIDVDVSGGTYIRALGEEIARRLGTVGHLCMLQRTRCCGISVQECVSLTDFDPDTPWQHWSIPPARVLADHDMYTADAAVITHLRQGRPLDMSALSLLQKGDLQDNPTAVILDESQNVISIIDVRENRVLRNI